MTESGEASVVPIALTLSGKTGYTVWAPPWEEDGDEWQAFLGADGKVWLFDELADLEATLHSRVENDLSDHPGYPMLQTLPAEQLSPDADYRYDLDAVPDLTEAEADAEVVEQVTDVIDMIERIAECCDNGTLLKLLEQPGFADLLGFAEEDEAADDDDLEDDEDDDEDLEEDDDLEDDSDDEDAWVEIGTAVRTAWPGVLLKIAECVAWRTADDLPEAEDEVETVAAEADVETEEEADAADVEFWTEVGIMPVELALPSGTGYTLRCYVDDVPRFLGTDMTVDMFRSRDGLAAFCQREEEHDLAGLDTWAQVQEAEELDVSPPANERFELTEVDAQLIGGPTVADIRLVRAAVDAIQDLAEYCGLAGVQAAFAADAPLGTTLTDLYNTAVGSSILPSYWSGEGAASQWRTVLDEVDTCVRWHE